tara:strand:- start:10230 stop:11576 length:1347 start_codon:yes stop_codon:yes gene_type:complete
MSTFHSPQSGVTVQSITSVNDNRRLFNFGERVAELAPQTSPFFVYLSKVAKKPTDDPVFKFLETRHQWQRRNFVFQDADSTADEAFEDANTVDVVKANIQARYDKYGKVTAGYNAVEFILPGQIVALETSLDGDAGDKDIVHYKVTEKDALTWTLTRVGGGTTTGSSKLIHADIPKGQVIGSAWAEGSGAPAGWEDKMFDREGYCQIFKTAMSLFSGTALATRYRGISNEWNRVWQEKLMEHKMDLEHAMLLGIGSAAASEVAGETTAPTRYTHGIVPYTESNGKVYNMSYASSGYDAFLDAMEDFFAPESGNSGNKLVLASRKVITYLNKLGSGSFLNNSVGSSQYNLDVQNVKGSFGHQVTVVNTIFGNLHFVPEPLFRGPWEDYCCAIDMANVAYRPLAGNGISRDTFIETNIQDNDADGRKDQIITEAGLEISLPETHALLKWS